MKTDVGKMLIIGLTGSIGMGKTTAGKHFAEQGVAVFDADQAVHELYRGPAGALIASAFPDVAVDGVIDRARLARVVMGFPSELARLEAIVHPLVRQVEWRFLREQHEQGAAMAALDIPLLFETGSDVLMDVSIVLTAPADVQRERVMLRPGMTEGKFAAMVTRQMSDVEKRARCDYVVDTSCSLADTHRELDRILGAISARPGEAYSRWRSLYEGKDAG
jgi:dephospho-CoA kinase